jgi:hypothetical protein
MYPRTVFRAQLSITTILPQCAIADSIGIIRFLEPDDPGGITNHYRVGRDIFSDDSFATDDATTTQSDSGQDYSLKTDPDIIV